MSIATRTGDAGTTALMYNRRVPKSDLRVEAYGCVDELNAALGMARATADQHAPAQHLLSIQQDLIALMGELATSVEDLERYTRDGHPRINNDAISKLDALVHELEASQISFRGWATPGANLHAAALDLARTVCRRAERRLCGLAEQRQLQNPDLIVYLNRLSDVLWLLARAAESPPGPGPTLV